MAASYPTSAASFTTKVAGDTVQESHVNALQDEVAAVETALLAGWTSYTPAWTGATANPAIGDGTLSGLYHKIGKVVFFKISITMGAATTYGTGYWILSLPSSNVAGGSSEFYGTATDTGSSKPYVCTTSYVAASTFAVVADGAALVDASTPFTWATTDRLVIQGWYLEA